MQTKENGAAHWDSAVTSCTRFSALRNGAGGASASAGTAIDAHTGIDDVLTVALGDGAHRASVGARATHHASVADHIGHSLHLQAS